MCWLVLVCLGSHFIMFDWFEWLASLRPAWFHWFDWLVGDLLPWLRREDTASRATRGDTELTETGWSSATGKSLEEDTVMFTGADPKPRPFANLGLSCFINTGLQALLSSRRFRLALSQKSWKIVGAARSGSRR